MAGTAGENGSHMIRRAGKTASLQDLVQARWHSTHPGSDELQAIYELTLKEFQRRHGEIVEDYWAEALPAAVAVSCMRRRFSKQLGLHRQTTRLLAKHPEFSRLMLRVDRESVRATNVLAGMSQTIAMSNLFSLTRDVTNYLETEYKRRAHPGESPGERAADWARRLAAYERDLDDIAAYIREAAARQAQIIYLRGTLLGIGTIFLVAPLIAWLFRAVSVPGVDPKLFVGCVVAGSLGAVMSVLMRMNSGKFAINHDIGRLYVTNLGASRPFIGAVFALLVYFAFMGDLIQQVTPPKAAASQFAFFIAAGFLVGFSERFAKEIVKTAEGGAGGAEARMEQASSGVQPELTPSQEAHVIALHVAGEHTPAEMAELLGVSRATIGRAVERGANLRPAPGRVAGRNGTGASLEDQRSAAVDEHAVVEMEGNGPS
ncbi:MAG: hypothetical protein ACR2KV_16720 [Solirubrobacteraceae bacterium]